MDAWVGYARKALHGALQQVGYNPHDTIRFITFESTTERVMINGKNDPTIDDLVSKCNHIRCAGGTSIQGVFKHLPGILAQHPQQPHTFIVISDGEISDQDSAVVEANKILAALKQHDTPIYGVLLRLKTGQYATPSTKALSCFGSFCSNGASVVDVPVFNNSSEEVAVLNLTQTIGIFIFIFFNLLLLSESS